MKRILGLDSIRFICALIVVLGHFGLPWPKFLSADGAGVFSLVGKVSGLMICGPAAVIAFFVISGFCIHYPFQNANKIDLLPFYTRRLLRIGIPAAIAFLWFKFLKMDLEPPSYGIFWSIICEIIYYLLYPLLFLLRRYVNWSTMFLVSFVVALIFMIANIHMITGGYYPEFGFMTWLIGLPCWISGCWLSENYTKFSILKSYQIWILRIFMIIVCMILVTLKFHSTNVLTSYPFTLTLFAPIACCWLGFEIRYFQIHQPSPQLESAGKWSYSLYIFHAMAFAVWKHFDLFVRIPNNALLIIASLLISYAFYLLIEKPSHKLSVYVSRLFLAKVDPIMQQTKEQ